MAYPPQPDRWHERPPEWRDLAIEPGGYSAKLFCGMRRFGEMSLPVVLQTLGVELLVAPVKGREADTPVERTGSCGHVQHLRQPSGEPSL
jgi:hypothetical protein